MNTPESSFNPDALSPSDIQGLKLNEVLALSSNPEKIRSLSTEQLIELNKVLFSSLTRLDSSLNDVAFSNRTKSSMKEIARKALFEK